jgi:type IV pilus assembly protein PilW
MRARHHRGMSLVELLVAVTVGLLVLLSGAKLLLSAQRGQALQAEAAEVDDAGRFAIETITRAARQAAYVNWDQGEAGVGIDTNARPRIAGLDNHLVSKASDGIAQPLTGAVNGSDILALGFGGAGQGAHGDGSITSCAGFGVGEGEDGWSIFFVARSATGEAELRCKYRGQASWGADAIVSGVDTFQVLYGIDTDDPADGIANLYVSARVVQALDDAMVLAGADASARDSELRRRTHWKRVASIKVGLVLHGRKQIHRDRDPAIYEVFGKDYAETQGSEDPGTRVNEVAMAPEMRGRERRVFGATIALRNPVH